MKELIHPIGTFKTPETIAASQISDWITEIELFPERLIKLTDGLSDDQLSLKYRPGGWTVRQVVHHCADSHMNSIIRFKLALTEDNPAIKPYLEAKWAEFEDSGKLGIDVSLQLLKALHARWVVLLRSLPMESFNRTYFHPEDGKSYSLGVATAMYAWHSNHHLAHIRLALNI